MKLEIELVELKGVGRLHQEGFSIESDGETFLRYCTTVPAGLPYIFVHKGPHAGKIFAVNPADMIKTLETTFFNLHTRTATVPAPGDIPSPSPSNQKP